jgi:DNA helicase-2/ATP-dependent DNA helicase PcrA
LYTFPFTFAYTEENFTQIPQMSAAPANIWNTMTTDKTITDPQPNPEQERIIREPLTRLVPVIAGAGTGKTSTITKRFAHLVRTGQARPTQILGITFTDKAAAHLKGKIAHELGNAVPLDELWVSTYHALCLRLLKEHAHAWALDPDFTILDENERILAIHEIVDRVLDEPHRDWVARLLELRHTGLDEARLKATALKLIEMFDIHNLYPDQLPRFLAQRREAYYGTAAERDAAVEQVEQGLEWFACLVFGEYHRFLEERNVYDFQRLEREVVRLLTDPRQPATAEHIRGRFTVIILDEFQDSNLVEMELVRALAQPELANVTLVGDPRQAIYEWRGARLENILEVARGRSESFDLVCNYRSHQDILDAAQLMIKRHDRALPGAALKADAASFVQDGAPHLEALWKVKKTLNDAGAAGDADVTAELVDTCEEEFIAARMKMLVNTVLPGTHQVCTWKDMAVLTRSNPRAKQIAAFLSQKGVPNFLVSTVPVPAPAWWLVSLLMVLENPLAEFPLVRLLESPLVGLDDECLYELAQERKRHGVDLLTCVLALPQAPPAALHRALGRAVPALTQWAALYQLLLQHLARLPFTEFVEQLISETKLVRWLDRYGADPSAMLNKIRAAARMREFDPANTPLAGFIRRLEQVLGAKEKTGSLEEIVEMTGDQVMVMTMHGAKGLEFPVVFVPSLHSTGGNRTDPCVFDYEQGLLLSRVRDEENPRYKAAGPGSPKTADAAVRLLYVAMTRAKYLLVLSENHKRGTKNVFEDLSKSPLTKRIQWHDMTSFMSLRHAAAMQAAQPAIVPTIAYDIPQRMDELVALQAKAQAARQPETLTVSVTRLAQFLECPWHYVLVAMELDHGPANRDVLPALAMGTAVHECIDRFTRQQGTNKQDLVKNVPRYFAPNAAPDAQAVAVQCLENYFTWWQEHGHPAESEKSLSLTLPLDEFTRLELTGIMDYFRYEGKTIQVVDFKTDREIVPGRHNWQLKLYAAMLAKLFPEVSISTGVVYLRGERFQEETPVFSSAELVAVWEAVRQAGLVIKLQKFDGPKNPALCGKCFYQGVCPGQPR